MHKEEILIALILFIRDGKKKNFMKDFGKKKT